MNIEQLQAVNTRLQEVLRFTAAHGESARQTHLKFQMIQDEACRCLAEYNSRKPYLLELMLRDPVVRCIMRADLCRPTWNGRPVVFATGVDAHRRAISAHENIGIDIMI